MKDQLIKILTHFGLTATRFADEIGVQRSSISHILSGRNKPSYDFILGIIEKYPSINPSWLLTGKGNMLLNESESETATGNIMIKTAATPLPDPNEGSGKSDRPENRQKSIDDICKQQGINTNVNDPEHIIVLFTDGTFVTYKKKNDR